MPIPRMFDLMQQKPPTNIRYVGQGGGGWSVGGGSKLVVIGWIGGGLWYGFFYMLHTP